MDYAKIVSEAEGRRAKLLQEMHSLDALIMSAKDLARLQDNPSAVRAVRVKISTTNETREITAQLLRERGAPIKTAELLPLLTDRGVGVGGKDPLATLSARLSNSDEFQSNRQYGWWFKNEPLPIMYPEEAGGAFQEQPPASDGGEGDPNGVALSRPGADLY